VWATDPLPIVRQHGLTAALLLIPGMAATQTSPAPAPLVTDANLQQARRNQPAITEQDIEQAKRTHPMPSDAELARVPIPSSPRIEALPQPRSTAPIDLEALAKGYAAQVDPAAQMPGLGSGPVLMIFISLSMPQATLQRLVDQAARAKASLLIRGLTKGSLRDTVAQIQGLIGQRQVAIQIDPQAFERYAVVQVPSFVIVRSGARLARTTACVSGSCASPQDYVRLAGDVSLDYALSHIQRHAPRFAKEAAPFLQRIKG
jgi:conjugal transfer pilus assembly protein TrbC